MEITVDLNEITNALQLVTQNLETLIVEVKTLSSQMSQTREQMQSLEAALLASGGSTTPEPPTQQEPDTPPEPEPLDFTVINANFLSEGILEYTSGSISGYGFPIMGIDAEGYREISFVVPDFSQSKEQIKALLVWADTSVGLDGVLNPRGVGLTLGADYFLTATIRGQSDNETRTQVNVGDVIKVRMNNTRLCFEVNDVVHNLTIELASPIGLGRTHLAAVGISHLNLGVGPSEDFEIGINRPKPRIQTINCAYDGDTLLYKGGLISGSEGRGCVLTVPNLEPLICLSAMIPGMSPNDELLITFGESFESVHGSYGLRLSCEWDGEISVQVVGTGFSVRAKAYSSVYLLIDAGSGNGTIVAGGCRYPITFDAGFSTPGARVTWKGGMAETSATFLLIKTGSDAVGVVPRDDRPTVHRNCQWYDGTTINFLPDRTDSGNDCQVLTPIGYFEDIVTIRVPALGLGEIVDLSLVDAATLDTEQPHRFQLRLTQSDGVIQIADEVGSVKMTIEPNTTFEMQCLERGQAMHLKAQENQSYSMFVGGEMSKPSLHIDWQNISEIGKQITVIKQNGA